MSDRSNPTPIVPSACSPRARGLSLLRWIAPSLLAGVVAASLVAWLAQSEPSALAQARAAGSSGSVAVIDLNRVLGLLDEQRARMNELEALGTEQQRRLDELRQELKRLADDIEVMPEGPLRRTQTEEAVRLRVRLETETRFAQMLVQDRQAMMLADLIGSIERACEEYAKREGFALVLSSDKAARLPDSFSLQQADLFLSNRRVLFAADSIDISQQVATMMNNAYRMRNDTP